ncbi:MAG: hypothetical protein AAFO79_06810 [Pseudomonadota bacterium]
MPRHILRLMNTALVGAATAGLLMIIATAQAQETKRQDATERAATYGQGCKSLVEQYFQIEKLVGAAAANNDFFSLEIISTDQLVTGQRGRYFAVSLKDPRRSGKFKFPGGRYVFERGEERLQKSLEEFLSATLDEFAPNYDVGVYVRGSASRTPMRRKRKLNPQFEYKNIAYLQAIRDGVYRKQPAAAYAVDERYGNDDLAYLRAAYLAELLTGLRPTLTPQILESRVAKTRSRSAQFAEVLLFVGPSTRNSAPTLIGDRGTGTTNTADQSLGSIILTPQEIAEVRQNKECKSFIRRTVELRALRRGGTLSTDNFDITHLENPELITGKSGSYYRVILKDAVNRLRFEFSDAEYVLAQYKDRFPEALTKLNEEIVQPLLDEDQDISLFVRGSASATPMRQKRRLHDAFFYRTIVYYPKVSDDIYQLDSRDTVEIFNRYGNDELPYLRSAFVSSMVQREMKKPEPILLEGEVSPSKAKDRQYAEVLLFVDWDGDAPQ